MTRTFVFLGLAVGLSLASLVAGRTPPPPLPPPVAAGVAARAPAAAPLAAPPVDDAPALAYEPVTAKDGVLFLEAKLSNTYVAAHDSEEFLEVNVAASDLKLRPRRVPVNLALVLDRSGSMAGQKLAEAKRAARELVAQLGSLDRLAIVDFGSDVSTLESQRGDAAGKERLVSYIDSVQDRGGTNIAGGLEAALRLVGPLEPRFKASRIVLISDGQPTEGVVDQPTLVRQVALIHEQGFAVSAIGVGVDFNGGLMREFAERGAGFYGFIDDAARLAEVFRRELDEAGQTVARQAELELTLPAGVELVEVYGRSAVREGRRYRLSLYDFSPGQTTRVTARLRVSSGAAVGTRIEVAAVTLRYVDVTKDARVASRGALLATLSDDPKLVRTVDRAVTENAHRAVAAQQLTLAAEAYERGDRASAFGFFSNIRALYGMSADALAGEDLNALQRKMESASSDSEVRYQAKSLEVKAMKSFGENNAY